MILKSTNGGNVFVNQVGSNIPTTFSLEQNYPNPFNPVTKIKFNIPDCHSCESGALGISLKIFNILGKKVTTLVNEKLQPGNYEVTWDASQYPSGVYFYKLITEGFSETKKMLLIK